jgi:hypothetical protein
LLALLGAHHIFHVSRIRVNRRASWMIGRAKRELKSKLAVAYFNETLTILAWRKWQE